MPEMNKYQLIEAILHDLGDQNDGIQVRGYRNANIVRGCCEALVKLRQVLQDEDAAQAAETEVPK